MIGYIYVYAWDIYAFLNFYRISERIEKGEKIHFQNELRCFNIIFFKFQRHINFNVLF